MFLKSEIHIYKPGNRELVTFNCINKTFLLKHGPIYCSLKPVRGLIAAVNVRFIMNHYELQVNEFRIQT